MLIVKDKNNTRTNYPMKLPLYFNFATRYYKGNLPYKFSQGSAVVLNGEIHILGGYGNGTKHYKFSNGEWISVSTLPYDFYGGQAVVLNNEIHILGDSLSENSKKHYKFSNGEWVSVSTLPYNFRQGSAVVLNGEIHILQGANHYKYSNNTWIYVSSIRYSFINGSAVVLNGEIHILGGSNSRRSHYKFSNGSWISVSTLPYNFYQSQAVVLNGEIHILGGYDSGKNHYKYSNGEWVSVSTLPYEFRGKNLVVVLDWNIYLLGNDDNGIRCNDYLLLSYENLKINNQYYSDYDLINDDLWVFPGSISSAVISNDEVNVVDSTKHYKRSNDEWIEVSELPYTYGFSGGSVVVLNDEIHILGGNGYSTERKYHYKYSNNRWIRVSTLPYDFAQGSAVVFNGEIHILGGTSSLKNHYKFSNGSWVLVSTLPYDFYNGQAVVLNGEIHILGGYGSSPRNHSVFSNNRWISGYSTLPYNFRQGLAVVLNDEIHILGGSGNPRGHYKYLNGEWVSVSTLPDNSFIFPNFFVFILFDIINIFGSIQHKHWKFIDNKWIAEKYNYEPSEDAVLIQDDLSHKFLANPSSMKVKIKVMKQDTDSNYYLDEEMRTIKNMWIKTGPTTFKEFVPWDIPIPD